MKRGPLLQNCRFLILRCTQKRVLAFGWALVPEQGYPYLLGRFGAFVHFFWKKATRRQFAGTRASIRYAESKKKNQKSLRRRRKASLVCACKRNIMKCNEIMFLLRVRVRVWILEGGGAKARNSLTLNALHVDNLS